MLAGCGGGGPAEPSGPLTIGVLSACTRVPPGFYENTAAGATVPLLERGARPVAWPPGAPYAGYRVGGRSLRLVYACSDGTPDSAREKSRQLVDDGGAEILLGPAREVEGKALALFAQNHRNVTVVNGSAANQASTLAVRSPRFFRFLPDAAQWTAGLGTYAYRQLGWRTAVVVGSDTTLGQTQAAGFLAEFCSLGGRVEARLWAPTKTADLGPYAERARAVGSDGTFTSLDAASLRAFLRARSDAPGTVLVGALTPGEPSPITRAAVAGKPIDATRRPAAWRRYVEGVRRRYPTADPDRLETVAYYDGMSAILEALERAGSTAPKDVRRALARLELETPHGTVRLDRNRNAVVETSLVRIDGLRRRTIRRLSGVEQTFGGYFTPDTRPPSRVEPPCVRRS